MYKNIKISASLICANWLQLKNDLDELKKNNIDSLHIDIIDGNFANDFTIGTSIIQNISNYTDINLDYHLMIEEPNYYFDKIIKPKSSIVSIHQECCKNLHREIINLKRMGVKKIGVALSPATPIEYLEYILEDIDLVLLMTANPEYMGKDLVSEIIKKIKNLKNKILKLNLKIEIAIDGSVNKQSVSNMVSAGADVLILGSSGLFKKDLTITNSLNEIYEEIDKIK